MHRAGPFFFFKQGATMERDEVNAFLDDFENANFRVETMESPEEETPTQTVDVLERAKAYAILFAERKELEDRIDDIKASMKTIESEITETMLFENPNVRVKVGEDKNGKAIFKTVHVQSTIRASHSGDKQALIEAMKENGLGVLVAEAFNHNTLSAHIRGLTSEKNVTVEDLMELVPESMRPHLKLTRTLSLGCKG